MDSKLVITIPQAVANTIIDNWNVACETIPGNKGSFLDPTQKATDDESIRSCEVRPIGLQYRKLYQDILNNVFPYIDYYQDDFGVNIYRKLEIQHTTYNVGGHYIEHRDLNLNDSKTTHRKISMVLMLSDKDSYGGGELVIAKKPFKEDKGSLILFRPSAIHSVQEVTSGIRKSLVMWVQGPEWR